MATEGDVRCCGQGGATTTDADRISGLSDDLLHSILLRLNSTPEAARTSVLTRRWRHVWQALPELSFPYHHEPSPFSAEPVCRRVNLALASCTAPAVDRLEIRLPHNWSHFPMHRVARWLRFASQRLAGELHLSMAPHECRHEDENAIVLPPCARATAIHLDLCANTLRFGPAGEFAALSTLRIEHGNVHSRELGDVVASRCPSLKELVLGGVSFPYGSPGLRVRSDTLERLEICFNGDRNMIFHGRRLVVNAPKLRYLTARSTLPDDTRIVAPMLSEVYWYGYPYDPRCQRLVDVGRHLERLDIHTNSAAAALMQLFDTIRDLNLTIDIPEGKKEFGRFLKNINHVSKCEVLLVRFVGEEHLFRQTVLHLLNKCACVKKLEVYLGSSWDNPSCPSCCPCRLPERSIADSVTLDSLEEIAIGYESSSAPLLNKEVCEKVCHMCHPNIKVEFTVLSSCRERFSYY
ncbi:unnamed protein product [Urochloa humidicola]